MLNIRLMTGADQDAVMPMVEDFYHSPAVEHPVDPAVLERTFQDAIDANEPLLTGLVLEEEGKAVGYAYLTECYSGEVGGRCVFFEEMYFQPQCRGKGYGTQVFRWVKEHYPHHRRVRLEVTDSNPGAIRLYEKLGFRFLEYRQMVLEGGFAGFQTDKLSGGREDGCESGMSGPVDGHGDTLQLHSVGGAPLL